MKQQLQHWHFISSCTIQICKMFGCAFAFRYVFNVELKLYDFWPMKSGLATFCQPQHCSLAKPIKFDFPMNITCVQYALWYFYYTMRGSVWTTAGEVPTVIPHLKFWVCQNPFSCEVLKGCDWSLWSLFSFCWVGLRVGKGAGGLWQTSYHHTHPLSLQAQKANLKLFYWSVLLLLTNSDVISKCWSPHVAHGLSISIWFVSTN